MSRRGWPSFREFEFWVEDLPSKGTGPGLKQPHSRVCSAEHRW